MNGDILGPINSAWTGKYCCGEIDDWSGNFPYNKDYDLGNE